MRMGREVWSTYGFVKLSTDFFIDDSMYYKAKELPGIENYEPAVPPA